MCGIVGAVTKRNIVPFLLEGLHRLEYRGYDSAGLAVLDNKNKIHNIRVTGKVNKLDEKIKKFPITSFTGIAHTRWATHGKPSIENAHPHISNDRIAIVHNGIIENYQQLRDELITDGYTFQSETDTETIAHLINKHLLEANDFLKAVHKTTKQLHGAFALAIINTNNPNRIIGARLGSPLVIGLGNNENFIASDLLALLSETKNFIYLEEGDIVDLNINKLTIYNSKLQKVSREIHTYDHAQSSSERGKFKHYMQKEIFEQPTAIENILTGSISNAKIHPEIFGTNATKIFPKVAEVQIVACGTSYHAGLVARYWLEELAGVACQVEIASEIRYRKKTIRPNTLFLTISQSGETADTLAALRQAQKLNYLSTLAICNVPQSSLVRESDMVFLTKAGPEIGVASTKAFTAQLTSLLLFTIALGKFHKLLPKHETELVKQLQKLPSLITKVLSLDQTINQLAEQFINKQHVFFLGRGSQYPIAMEGALKLKEISYIHAESYAAGELKHGPLALIDQENPVIVIVPNNNLLQKIISNINEVKARGGQVFAFMDKNINNFKNDEITVIKMPTMAPEIASIAYTVPLQLLAYHVAVLKGTDVDQPRNLAKCVTVE